MTKKKSVAERVKAAATALVAPAETEADDGLLPVLVETVEGKVESARAEAPHERSFHVRVNGLQFYHCGTADDGTWIYRQEK